MKKPFLDVWGYIASNVSESEYMAVNPSYQAWVSLEKTRPDIVASIPSKYIRYFKDIEEIKAKIARDKSWVKRSRSVHRELFVDADTIYACIRERNTKSDFDQVLGVLCNRHIPFDQIIGIDNKYTFDPNGRTVPVDTETLKKIAEEIESAGKECFLPRVQFGSEWGERTKLKVIPAPGVPLVFDIREEVVRYSHFQHKKAEALYWKKQKMRESRNAFEERLFLWKQEAKKLAKSMMNAPLENSTAQMTFVLEGISKELLKEMRRYGITKKVLLDRAWAFSPSKVITAKSNFKLMSKRILQDKTINAWSKRTEKAVSCMKAFYESQPLPPTKRIKKSMAEELFYVRPKLISMYRIAQKFDLPVLKSLDWIEDVLLKDG